MDVNKQECINCNKKLPELAWYDEEAVLHGQIDYFLDGSLIHSCSVKHLDDMEISSFVDGVSDNKEYAIEHLNECAYCFEITSATMQSVETEKETCKKLDDLLIN